MKNKSLDGMSTHLVLISDAHCSCHSTGPFSLTAYGSLVMDACSHAADIRLLVLARDDGQQKWLIEAW